MRRVRGFREKRCCELVAVQVNNSYFSENVSAIQIGDMKLIRGPPGANARETANRHYHLLPALLAAAAAAAGDLRTLAWPALSPVPVPLGLTGATIEPGTDHVSCQGNNSVTNGKCEPWCLFNLTSDPGESHDLCCGPTASAIAASLIARLDEEGAKGPPNSWTYGTDQKKIHAVNTDICQRAVRQNKNCATIEPFDWNNSAVRPGCAGS